MHCLQNDVLWIQDSRYELMLRVYVWKYIYLSAENPLICCVGKVWVSIAI